jgi:hypothetical protein
MFDYKETLQKMRRGRASMQAEIEKLGQAIAALQALVGTGVPAATKSGISAKAHRRISQTQKKRWAKVKRTNHRNASNTAKAKRKISAQGLRNIIRAQNKRWGKVRAAAKAKVKGTAGKKASEPAKKK